MNDANDHILRNSPDALEQTLAALSQPAATDANLWQTALTAGRPAQTKPFRQRSFSLRRVAPYAAAATLLLVVGVALLPLTQGTGSRLRVQSQYPPATSAALPEQQVMARTQSGFTGSTAVPTESLRVEQAPAVRHVVRKATIDLQAKDVRSGFAKVALIPSEALGEYVENSSLTGEEPYMRATLTLRVAANRLSDALNNLRALGTVTSESSGGQDVTDSIIDLEARIRNEERIEREILALLDKRTDAPLSDVLAVRTQLNDVRGRIESLKAQRDRVGQLVSLATIVVSLHSEDAQPATNDQSLGAYFQDSMKHAWESSLRTLSDTAAFLVRLFVGGLVWWLLLAFVAAIIWRGVRLVAQRQAHEPAPKA